ncbi:hypothetical protein MPSEU_000717700 [Mayamaea pseudoterrestris]|nr:hypothetical protein MPSEU_000429300 [Mayamaea pseudoterrestris]GKY97593.1 hypothetical protein MPSEU_000717700 [Mayamaea pseudoterrestris]
MRQLLRIAAPLVAAFMSLVMATEASKLTVLNIKDGVRRQRSTHSAAGSDDTMAQIGTHPTSSFHRRVACNVYLWDAPSALFQKWCRHLMRDCIYEGKGGTKFVRIEPGSLLQLLYPSCLYNPDRCLLCGGRFPDHLTLRWAGQLYTPFDRFLDESLAEGTKNLKGVSRARKRHKRTLPSVGVDIASDDNETVGYVFHRRYVGVDNYTTASAPSNKKVTKRQTKAITETDGNLPLRTSRALSYAVSSMAKKRMSFNLLLARQILLESIGKLVELENTHIVDGLTE